MAPKVPLAGGEGAHSFQMAKQMMDLAGVSFIQVDAGRIGGITPAKAAAEYAHANGVTFVNHAFTSHLQLSASLQPYLVDVSIKVGGRSLYETPSLKSRGRRSLFVRNT